MLSRQCTCKSSTNMLINHANLFDRPRILQLGNGLLFDPQDDHIRSAYPNGKRALVDGLHRILDLEEMAVGRKDGQRAVVTHSRG